MTSRSIAIIQARMGSSRLPGKVLMPLAGIPVLQHVIERLGYSQRLDGVAVATTIDPADDPILDLCEQLGIPVYRGSLDDVLDRYHRAAAEFDADPIVRITADCPAVDPTVVDAVVAGYQQGEWDLFGLAGGFPDGLDCTVFRRSALDRAWKDAKLKSEREHVGPYIEHHPELFRTGGIEIFEGLGHHRWTLDEPQDYELLTEIFDVLYDPDRPFLAADVLDLLEERPELLAINDNVIRNEGYLISLDDDEVVR